MNGTELKDGLKGVDVQSRAISAGDIGFADQTGYADDGQSNALDHDKRDMWRLGKRQELKRRFKYCKYIRAEQYCRLTKVQYEPHACIRVLS